MPVVGVRLKSAVGCHSAISQRSFSKIAQQITHREFKPAKNSPRFDYVVTAENCYYYMSLLESFYELEQSMSPELFKRYIVAAEKRYLQFLTRSQAWYGESEPLPLDIAYAWHAHLLSPIRYREDCSSGQKRDPYLNLPLQSRFPLKQMHKQRIKKSQGQEIDLFTIQKFPVYPWVLDVDELQHKTFDHITRCHIDNWSAYARETKERFVHRQFALYIKCASCGEQLFLQSWEEYAEFRTDPNVSIRCPSFLCKNPDNTINSIAVQGLLDALPHNVKGTYLDRDGRFFNKFSEEKKQREYIEDFFDRVIKTRKKPLHCIKDACDLLSDHCSGFDTPDPSHSGQKHVRRSYAREFIDIIRSTYEGNPTDLSLDLVHAMNRQREFIRTMVTEVAPKWVNPMELEIPNAIRDYHDFLLVSKSQQNRTPIIPTWSVDMVWHVHMLYTERYTSTGFHTFNRILNHDDVIAPFALNEHFNATERAWKNAFPSLVGLNIVSMTMQGIHSWNPSLMQKAHEYKELQKAMINYHTRRRLESNGITFTRPRDLSYHGIGAIHQESHTTSKSSEKKPADTFQEIFKGIEYTGYGYIGSSVCIKDGWNPSDIRKRIEATLLPPVDNRFIRGWHKRWVGRIPLGSEIKPITSNIQGFSTHKKGTKFRPGSRFQWWVPANGLYGLMRRKYSKKHREWGWTTNGFDWYPESECNYVPVTKGEFFGAAFRASADTLNSGTNTGFSFLNNVSSGFDGGSYDTGDSSWSSGGGFGGGDSGGYSGGSGGGSWDS